MTTVPQLSGNCDARIGAVRQDEAREQPERERADPNAERDADCRCTRTAFGIAGRRETRVAHDQQADDDAEDRAAGERGGHLDVAERIESACSRRRERP